MYELATIFTLGLLSSAHCVGMCGGFAATIGATAKNFRANFLRQLIYSVGRVFTYVFLGACGGYVGLRLSGYQNELLTIQQIFSVVAGVVMILVGASVLGLIRLRWLSMSGPCGVFIPMFKHYLESKNVIGFFLAGIANGFLPCGLVIAFLAKAVSTGEVMRGMAIMAAFGLGTMPAMIAIGCGSALISHKIRIKVFRVAACLIIITGVVTISRGMPGKAESCHDESSLVSLHSTD